MYVSFYTYACLVLHSPSLAISYINTNINITIFSLPHSPRSPFLTFLLFSHGTYSWSFHRCTTTLFPSNSWWLISNQRMCVLLVPRSVLHHTSSMQYNSTIHSVSQCMHDLLVYSLYFFLFYFIFLNFPPLPYSRVAGGSA